MARLKRLNPQDEICTIAAVYIEIGAIHLYVTTLYGQ